MISDGQNPARRVVQEFMLFCGIISLSPRIINGKACINRSKISTGSTSVPENNIFSFSQMCGSGKNGARPSVRQSITTTENGIELRTFILLPGWNKHAVSSFLHLRQSLKMVLLLCDNKFNLSAGIVIIKNTFYKLVKKDRIFFKRF